MSKFELPKTLTLEERRKYFKGSEGMAKIFGQELVDAELERLKISDILQIDYVPFILDKYSRPVKNEPSKFYISHLGEGADYRSSRLGHVYLNHYQYQSASQPAMLESMLVQKFPFLNRMSFKAYSDSSDFKEIDKYEIYIKYENPLDVVDRKFTWDSIQVPVQALIDGDIQKIIDRNEGYIRSYLSMGRTKGWEPIADDLINQFKASPELKQLTDFIQNDPGMKGHTVFLSRDLNGPLLDSTVAWIFGIDAADIGNSTERIVRAVNEDPISGPIKMFRSADSGLYETKIKGHSIESDDIIELMKKSLVLKELGFSVLIPDHMLQASKTKHSM